MPVLARQGTTRGQIDKNSTDLIQRQTDPLGRADEREPADYVAGVATLVSAVTMGPGSHASLSLRTRHRAVARSRIRYRMSTPARSQEEHP